MDNQEVREALIANKKKKKKRIMIIVGSFITLIVVAGISGSATQKEQTEKFTANKEKVLIDLKEAVATDNEATFEAIQSEYSMVDDYELKALFAEYDNKQDKKEEAHKVAKQQAKERSKYVNPNDPIIGEVLEVRVKLAEVRTHVGGKIIGESSVSGVCYLCTQFSYKNISKSPTYQKPTLIVISPDGSEYSSDISASGFYAGEVNNFDIEVLSELNPQVHSNDVEVFKLPASFKKDTGWKLEVTLGSGFSRDITKWLKLN